MRAYPALGFDPVPGRIDPVQDLLRKARDVSCELNFIERQLATLGQRASGWQGEAASAFAQRVGELPHYLSSATDAADTAKRALARWLEALEANQQKVAGFENAAKNAKDSLRSAKELVRTLREAMNAAGPECAADYAADLASAQKAVAAAQRAFDAALKSANDVLDDHRTTADMVAAALEQASRFAPPEPGFFERVGKGLDDLVEFVRNLPAMVKDFVREHAELIKSISGVLSDISTILSILPFPQTKALALVFAAAALGGTLLADYGGAKVSPLTYVSSGLGFVGTGFSAIGLAGRTGAMQSKVLYLARGQSGGVQMADDALRYYGKVIPRYEHIADGASFVTGVAGTIDEGDIPFEHWVPSTPGEAMLGAVSPAGLAFYNAAIDGMAKDRLRNAEALEKEWVR